MTQVVKRVSIYLFIFIFIFLIYYSFKILICLMHVLTMNAIPFELNDDKSYKYIYMIFMDQ